MTANLNLFKATIAAMLLTEGVSDTGCENLNKIQATALELGGTNFDKEEGACYVEIAGPENAQQFIDYLDGEDCVEAYDVTVSGDALPEDADILDLPEETVFGFAIYLDGDEVTYEGAEMDDEELDEAVSVDVQGVPAIEAKKAEFKKWVAFLKSENPAAYKIFISDSDDVAKAYVQSSKDKDVGSSAISAYTYDTGLYEGADPAFSRIAPDFVSEFGETISLDEVKKRIQVSFTGKKRVKMQCAKGFKYDATAKTCVKIGGDELATRRKASIKALVSRKAGGAALKNRAAIRTKKAMKFRSALGLK